MRLLAWCIVVGAVTCILAAVPLFWKFSGIVFGIWWKITLLAVLIDVAIPAEGREPIDENTRLGKIESAAETLCDRVGSFICKLLYAEEKLINETSKNNMRSSSTAPRQQYSARRQEHRTVQTESLGGLWNTDLTKDDLGEHGEFDINDEVRAHMEDMQQAQADNPRYDPLEDGYDWDEVTDAINDGYITRPPSMRDEDSDF